MDINELRAQIDDIDTEIVKAIKKRFDIVNKISQFKKTHKIPINDFKREKEVLDNREALAKKYNLDTKMIKEVFTLIVNSAIKFQFEDNKKNKEN
jgi:chorismate mutase